jgi:hypothetical protein
MYSLAFKVQETWNCLLVKLISCLNNFKVVVSWYPIYVLEARYIVSSIVHESLQVGPYGP